MPASFPLIPSLRSLANVVLSSKLRAYPLKLLLLPASLIQELSWASVNQAGLEGIMFHTPRATFSHQGNLCFPILSQDDFEVHFTLRLRGSPGGLNPVTDGSKRPTNVSCPGQLLSQTHLLQAFTSVS